LRLPNANTDQAFGDPAPVVTDMSTQSPTDVWLSAKALVGETDNSNDSLMDVNPISHPFLLSDADITLLKVSLSVQV